MSMTPAIVSEQGETLLDRVVSASTRYTGFVICWPSTVLIGSGVVAAFSVLSWAFWPLGDGLRAGFRPRWILQPITLALLPFTLLGGVLFTLGLLGVALGSPLMQVGALEAELSNEGVTLRNWRKRCVRFLPWPEITEIREVPEPSMWRCEAHLMVGEIVTFESVREREAFPVTLANRKVKHTRKDDLTGEISDHKPKGSETT